MTWPTSPPAAQEPTAVTRLAWGVADALTDARDLTRTHCRRQSGVRDAGHYSQRGFCDHRAIAGGPDDAGHHRAHRPAADHLRRGSGNARTATALRLSQGLVAWLPSVSTLGDATADFAPEILLLEQGPLDEQIRWNWTPQIIDAGEFDTAYTLDAARFNLIGRNSDLSLQYEYAGDGGDTIRFGDDVFGVLPDDGADFQVTYRIGAGAAGNVAAGAINQVAPSPAAAGILAVTNPLPATGGADREALDSVRLNAPQAFRAVQYRAVIAGGLRGCGRNPALGAARRHDLSLDRQLAHRIHHRRSARKRGRSPSTSAPN